MNPYEKDSNAKKDDDVFRIEMRSQYMSSGHSFICSLVLVVALCIILLCSTASTPMLIYEESEIYSCPRDWAAEIGTFSRL